MELVADVNAHVYACCTLFSQTHWIEFQVQVRSANGQFDSYELVGADRRWRRQQQFSLNAPQFTTNLDTKISSLFFFVVLLNDTLFSLVCMLLFYGMLPTLCHVLLNIDVVTLFRIVNIISTSDDEHGNLTPYTH